MGGTRGPGVSGKPLPLKRMKTVASDREQFAIVVAGKMNPAIHHPAWYEHAGILRAEDVREAHMAPVICMQEFATFRTRQLEFVCERNRWSLATDQRDLIARIREIAGKVFARLDETPVSAFGFNFTYVREVPVADVGSTLAAAVGPLGVGPVGDGVRAKIAWVAPLENGAELNMKLSGLEGSEVLVDFNLHHQIRIAGHFNLAELIESSYDREHRLVEQQLGRVLKGLQALESKKSHADR